MKRAYLCVSLGLSLLTAVCEAKLVFQTRCDPAQPTVLLTIDENPVETVACRIKDRRPQLYFTRSGSLTLGSQTYPLREEWPALGKNCAEALRGFHEFPEIPFRDPEVGTAMEIRLNSELTFVRLDLGLNREACRGRRVEN